MKELLPTWTMHEYQERVEEGNVGLRTLVTPTTATARGLSPSFSCAHLLRTFRTASTPQASSALSFPLPFPTGSRMVGRKADEERKTTVGC